MPVDKTSAQKGVLKRLEKQVGDLFFKSTNKDEFNNKSMDERIQLLKEFKSNHSEQYPRIPRKKYTKVQAETEKGLNSLIKTLNNSIKEIDSLIENNDYNDSDYNFLIENLTTLQSNIKQTIQSAKDRNIEVAEKQFEYWKKKIENLKKK